MSDPGEFRRERITRLLEELRYEIERGMLEREIDETMGYSFYVPLSQTIPDGVVLCKFWTRPIPRVMVASSELRPRLRLVKGDA